MQTFHSFYGLQLAIVVLSHSDNLSSSLQIAEPCAVNAHAKLSFTVLRGIWSDGNASLQWTKVLKLLWCCNYKQLHFHISIRCYQGILRVLLNLSTIRVVEDFDSQIYIETVDTIANCIVNVNQLCDFYTEFDSNTLQIQFYLCWLSPITISGKVKGWYIALCHWFPQKEQKDLFPHSWGHVLGQDYSGYASNKCQLWMRLQCTEKGDVLSLYNHIKQLPQTSYDVQSA